MFRSRCHPMMVFRIKICFIFMLIVLYIINIMLILKFSIDSSESFEDSHKYGEISKIIEDEDIKNSLIETQQNKIKEMMLHAWKNYKTYAWGKNELDPIRRTYNNNSIFRKCEIGATIIDALDTLYIMNLTEEYDLGRNWILNEFTLDKCNEYISVFELNIRFIGGFLSLYALTGDLLFKEKAKYVADKIMPAFSTPSKIPYAKINFDTGKCDKGMTVIADCGTLSLEFRYLSVITNDSSYVRRVKEINKALRALRMKDGLYPYWIEPLTGAHFSEKVSFGGNSDSFYEYLLKAWIQSGSKDQEMRKWFTETIDSLIEHLVKTTVRGVYYITGQYQNYTEHKMDHLSCFAGGFFALAANSSIYSNSKASERLLKIGKELTRTCRKSYVTSNTGLGPELMSFHPLMQDTDSIIALDHSYKLRPETIESYFYLWRITQEQKYRDWTWDVVIAIEKYCRTPYGYTGIEDVYLQHEGYDGVQQSFFMAETLKYMYLVFSDSVLPLDKWIFNTEAHPLPILNKKL